MLEHWGLVYFAEYNVMKREGEDWSGRIKLKEGWRRGEREEYGEGQITLRAI